MTRYNKYRTKQYTHKRVHTTCTVDSQYHGAMASSWLGDHEGWSSSPAINYFTAINVCALPAVYDNDKNINGNIITIKEPQGLLRTKGKRPDGLTHTQHGEMDVVPHGMSESPTSLRPHTQASHSLELAQQLSDRRRKNIQKSAASIFFPHPQTELSAPLN
jgi:hypothetical protein